MTQPSSESKLRESDLVQFTGSTEFYRHWTNHLLYTEGIQFMAKRSGAYWLIDAIASYQPDKRIKSRPELIDFQLWELTVAEDCSAVLTIHGDSDQTAVITQKIPYSDFPLPRIKLYVCSGTLLLPSEY